METERPAREFRALDCPQCGEMICDTVGDIIEGGVVLRLRCPNHRCKRRLWLALSSSGPSVVMVDRPPRQRPKLQTDS